MYVINHFQIHHEYIDFIDSFILTLSSGLLIHLFVIKPLIFKFAKFKIVKNMYSEKIDYYSQQIEGLNRSAIVIIVDQAGIFKHVNEKFCLVSGYSVNEVIGKNISIINSDFHSVDFLSALWKLIRSGKIWNGEIKYKTKFNGIYWVDSTVVPLKNSTGQIIEYLFLEFDISHKKESDLLYKELISVTADGFWLADITGRILEVNCSYCILLGYQREEILKMRINDLEALETADETALHIQKVMEAGNDKFETKHRKKDGELIDVEISVSYLPNRGGIFIVFVRDISEKNRLIGLLEAERDVARKQADSKSRFLSTMSHEIRTPIGGIVGMTHLLLESEERPAVIAGLSRILNTAEILSDIVNEILDFSRIESGNLQIENVEFNFRDNLYSVAALFEVLAKERGIEFSCEVGPQVPISVIGDGLRLKQILTNLVGNAIKFTNKGKVRLDVFTGNVLQESAEIIFKIEDSGIGISAEVLKTLSNPFVQADNSISRKYGGSGLGLYISKNLLKFMNSELDIKSEFGVGSIFSFKINFLIGKSETLIQDKAGVRRAKLSQIFSETIPHLSGIHLIVAEDDQMNQLVISGYLKLAKLNFKLVNNGEECVKLLQDIPNTYHGILMDVHMPIMSGLDATLKIREFDAKIPIIAMTAGVTIGEQKNCLNVGMNDILMKPLDPAKLARVLNKHITALR
jgi:PAS domain S-box-containing protein